MFDSPAELLTRMGHAARSEAMAAANKLDAIGELYALRLTQHGEREQWAIDTDDAVAAEVAAALRTSVAMGRSNLRYARAMREQLPLVADTFRAGDIDFRLFRVIVYRTELVTDETARAAVDAQLAARARRWQSMTSHRLAAAVDRVVAKVDRDAVRRSREDIADRRFDVTASETGFSYLNGVVFATAGEALDRRLNELAATVCPDDPRTVAQRRADALGALAAGADQLACGCGRAECDLSSARGQRSGVVVHVVANQSALDGSSENPAMVQGNGLIPAEVLRELARSAKLQPLTVPVDAPPEPRYHPSTKLADFVRARDLTCRAPGCDRPATHCDVDHTIPHSAGGPTHASNLKCLCRFHHLLKTFWGWSDKQLPDGTVIWTAPSGHTYVTTPGSALLFPSLTVPTGDLPVPSKRAEDDCGERAAMMPKRRRSRRQERTAGIRAERAGNRRRRDPVPPQPGDEPPPF
ncbi:HNH endonuclease signature motif containing protein [Candidatus Mycolicibacterium alkanivorans]|uniref:HNH endonuclease n=1 Tax=Candidatus Mycolicibacterium alkanivorans TaxID=2954114 RepID=A0ABS9Z036_9MYCO|nr:HNH endonuclease signature motif containing protein [Candidatus Mycolicibacterium alkanivorans]MCI4676876.1 HNH endonuclease [Candidatus Mycolicibacterium alkanivorans]